jgi:hypothetical protein
MPLFEVTEEGLKRRPSAAFAALGMYERADLQRLLRDDISALDEDLLVIAEEFGNWEDARRRIDLLALDKGGRLVVIELKRTDDGGHMELQAIRYAAMVSAMRFAEVADAYAAHRAEHRPGEEVTARAELAAFLDAGDGGEKPVISTDVRIMLVSADRLRRKDVARERARSEGRDFTRYHIVVDGLEGPHQNKRNAIRTMVEALAGRGMPLARIRALLPERVMRVVPGRLTDAVEVAAAQTEPALAALVDAFPDEGVNFRRAETGDA